MTRLHSGPVAPLAPCACARWRVAARAVALACALLAGACATQDDPDCALAERALSDATYRATLKAAVDRQFDAGQFGHGYRQDVTGDMPGTVSVPLAPEFNALASRPLQQRLVVDARGDIDAVFVGWPPGRGVLVDVRPNDAVPVTRDYGDGVGLICEAGN